MSDSFATPWTVAHQALLSMEFSKQEYWSGCHFLLQGIFPTQGSNPRLLHWQVDSLPLHHLGSPDYHLFLQIVVLAHIHALSSSCFWAVSAGLNSCCRDCLAHKTWNIYHLALHRKDWSCSALEHQDWDSDAEKYFSSQSDKLSNTILALWFHNINRT